MTDLLVDECYSCMISSLVLIKSLASQRTSEASGVIELAAELGQTAIDCIRSNEAGSVLPETAERLAKEIQCLIDEIKATSIRSNESAACATACENFIRTYRHQAA